MGKLREKSQKGDGVKMEVTKRVAYTKKSKKPEERQEQMKIEGKQPEEKRRRQK
jgi:hypothetical protein